jgi:hypothetical protein
MLQSLMFDRVLSSKRPEFDISLSSRYSILPKACFTYLYIRHDDKIRRDKFVVVVALPFDA